MPPYSPSSSSFLSLTAHNIPHLTPLADLPLPHPHHHHTLSPFRRQHLDQLA